MRRAVRALLTYAVLALLPALSLAAPADELCLADANGLRVADARLLDGIGPYRAAPVSRHAEAQRYFEQAMVMNWGFNFAEAVRSFRAAGMRDPTCAACRWGIAWALGPSINHDVAAADLPVIADALVQARVHASDARTRALVEALALRFPDGRAPDSASERRYAEAMVALAAREPRDADLAVLAAEALMTAHAYDWWQADGSPQPWTREIVALLARALALAPDHPGAHHYVIHLYDESRTPEKALPSAERLPALAPGVGHLVHMPSHTYLRLGRYHDAVRANQAAVAADERYAAVTRADPAYIAGYALHNRHFLWTAALMSGESGVARTAADAIASSVADWPGAGMAAGTREHLLASPWLTDVRFGDWAALRARPTDPAAGPYLRGLQAYARGTAFARTGDAAAAARELTTLRAARRAVAAAEMKMKSVNSAADLLGVAEALLAAEVAAARGDRAGAVRQARVAVAREDALAADEPPAWPVPARPRLAAWLLAAGQPAAAAAVLEADLTRHPDYGPSLAGLADSQRRRGRTADAERTAARAQAAWRHADVPLTLP
jgi:predicted Zn-dependent protease